MRQIHCLRCGSRMKFYMREQIQLGKHGWLLGDLPHLLAGALEVDFYVCPACGKLELFQPNEGGPQSSHTADELSQRICPACGREHDFDFPRCPHCGHDYHGQFPESDPEPEPDAGLEEEPEDPNMRNPRTGVPQRPCPQCGAKHDFDFPRCPQCGYAYPEFR